MIVPKTELLECKSLEKNNCVANPKCLFIDKGRAKQGYCRFKSRPAFVLSVQDSINNVIEKIKFFEVLLTRKMNLSKDARQTLNKYMKQMNGILIILKH